MSLLQMSFSGAVLILVIAVIRMIAIHRLPKKTFLALWIIALARLLLPFSVPSPFSVYSLVRENKSDLQISDTLVRENESDLQISDTIAYEARQPVYREAAEEIQTGHVVSDTPQTLQAEPSEALPSAPLPSESARTPSVSIWTILWLIGMLIPAGSFSVSYLRCRREFRTSLPIENDTITEWLEGHRLKRKIEIRQFSGIMTPMTYGLFYPVILLPENTDFENKQQLQYILYHEYVHIRNYDAALKLLAAAALCIHWFNPMVWVMYILFNRDIELTCDESVVHNFGRENRSAYAKMLISMEERKSRFSPFFNNFSKTAIEERIKSIMKTKKTSVLALILSVVVVTGTAGCFATSVQENKNNTEQTESDRDVEAANDPSASAEWSFEKICSLIKIDGTPLKFPCTFEEISSINNITIEDPNDGLGFYDIYYNGTNVGLISFDKDTGTSRFISLYYYDDEAEENIDGLTFAGYSAEQETEINNFMDENFNISYDRSDLSAEDFYRKVYEFEQGNQKMEFTIDFDDSKLYLIRIRLDEIEPLSESAETKQTETRQDVEAAAYDVSDYPVYPVPEGWSFEKICSLIEIDGTPLKFPCTLDEFLSHNDNIKAEKLDDIYNYYDIYCNDKNVGLLSIKKDTEISDYMRCDYYNNEEDEYINEMTFAGYTVEQESEINKFLDKNFNVSYERSSPLVGSFYQRGYIFEQNNKILEFTVCFENSKLCLVIIKLDEIKPLSESAETKQTETRQDVEAAAYDDAYDYLVYPVPEGWSFEKICSLIEIDGTPLKFPCTFEEISNISDNITVEKADTDFNYYDIYYGKTNVGTMSFKKDTGISDVIKCDYYNDDTDETIHEMTFAGYSAEQETEINDFLAENFTLSLESHSSSAKNFYRKVYAFKNNNQKMELSICFEDSKLYLIIITLKEIEALPESDDLQNVLLPDGMSMDDLRNMLIINGKTLTMPTTLNNIMAIDDKFSYKAEYIDDKHYLYQGKNGFYVDILYDKKPFFSTTLASDTNDVKEILDEGIYSIFVSKNVCKKTDIDVTTSYNLNFDSSYEDIVNVFGEPNTKNNDNINKEYEFYDNIYKYDLCFNVNSDEDKIYIITIKINPK